MSRISSCHFITTLLLLSFLLPILAQAQTKPQFVRFCPAGPPSSTIPGSAQIYLGSPAENRGRKFQCIYEPKYFKPTPPGGYIRNIYFYAVSFGSLTAGSVGTIYNVRISMGYTTRDTFRYIAALNHVRDTFITGLTTVFTADSLVEDLRNTYGYWLKIPLQGSGFVYSPDNNRNLVVEVAFGMPWVKNYFRLSDSSTCGGRQQLAGYRDSSAVERYNGSELQVGTYGSYYFGFDMGNAAGISPAFSRSGSTQLSVSPNPSTGHLSLQSDIMLQGALITVRDAVGRQVLRRPWQKGGNVTENVDLSDAPGGLYFIEVSDGSLRLTERVMLQ